MFSNRLALDRSSPGAAVALYSRLARHAPLGAVAKLVAMLVRAAAAAAEQGSDDEQEQLEKQQRAQQTRQRRQKQQQKKKKKKLPGKRGRADEAPPSPTPSAATVEESEESEEEREAEGEARAVASMLSVAWQAARSLHRELALLPSGDETVDAQRQYLEYSVGF